MRLFSVIACFVSFTAIVAKPVSATFGMIAKLTFSFSFDKTLEIPHCVRLSVCKKTHLDPALDQGVIQIQQANENATAGQAASLTSQNVRPHWDSG
jgi:hypothetical protein